MNPALQSWLQLALLVLAILATILHTDKRFDAIDRRFEQIDKRFERLEHRLDVIEADLKEFFKTSARQETEIARLKDKTGLS